jgi:hypothetical protein
MRRRSRDPVRRLRATVAKLPRHTREAMLRGIDSNRIIVGAYVDPSSGGVCPMLAAHRNGGRTSVASFARAWDEFTDARRPRRASRREVRALRSLLEQSLEVDSEIDRTPIAALAEQIRAEREAMARRLPTLISVPEPSDAAIKVTRPVADDDLLAITERELTAEPLG